MKPPEELSPYTRRRLALGIHGWALAAIVGVHPATYRNLEVGRRKASPAEAAALDAALTTLERATIRAKRASRHALDQAARS